MMESYHMILLAVGLFLQCTIVNAFVALPPSDDPFYQPPAGFEAQSPGTILRSRRIPKPIAISTSLSAAYQLLFRSTDSIGRPNAVLTSIYVPQNANLTKVVSVQEAYDSPDVDCSPSYLYTSISIESSMKSPAVEKALSSGWVVASPDYEGFDAAFTNGIQSGQAVLDSVRAVLQSRSVTGIPSNAQVALVGGSGGALASEWALELQSSYAPHTKIVGALLTALTPNVTSVLLTVDGTADAGLIPLSLLGLAKQDDDMGAWISYNLVPSTASLILGAGKSCPAAVIIAFTGQRIESFLSPNASLLTKNETPQNLINKVGIMGLHGTPKVPLFIFKGTADEVSPVADTDALVNKYCKAGATIEYQRDQGANHGTSTSAGIPAGWPWLSDRLSGVPLAKKCSIMNV